ncbi:MAG: hypothetical protein NW201_08970 [Gemmatimonadales bacterium]|nr:hypothetical protein [Gemmatimonadales bacterium]
MSPRAARRGVTAALLLAASPAAAQVASLEPSAFSFAVGAGSSLPLGDLEGLRRGFAVTAGLDWRPDRARRLGARLSGALTRFRTPPAGLRTVDGDLLTGDIEQSSLALLGTVAPWRSRGGVEWSVFAGPAIAFTVATIGLQGGPLPVRSEPETRASVQAGTALRIPAGPVTLLLELRYHWVPRGLFGEEPAHSVPITLGFAL